MTALPSLDTLAAYRSLVAASEDAILIADWETARFVDANQVAIDKLGYSLAQLREMTGGDLSQLPREEHRRLSAELIGEGETRVRGVPIRCGDGTELRMDLWVRKFDSDGVTYSASVLRDAQPATDDGRDTFRVARRRLLDSEAFYRGVVTCTEDAVLVADFDDDVVVEANPAACRLFGRTTVEWSSATRKVMFAPESRARLETMSQALGGTGHAQWDDAPLCRRDGSVFVADLMLNVFESAGRRYVVTIVRDVTERHRRREELERSRRLAAIGEVAAGVAHEINNPAAYALLNLEALDAQHARMARLVAALQDHAAAATSAKERDLFAELLQIAPNVDALAELARDNREGLQRIRAVTNDLRSFSRVGDHEVVEEDLNAVVRQTVSLLNNELRHRARLTMELDERVPRLAAQRGKLAQVVTNLLLNAAQAITEGDADGNVISITTRCEGDEVVLAVEDTGEGMDAETANRIFDPFFTTKKRDQGTGLGLSLCVEILSRHGGRIEVESQPGQGARFEVRMATDTGLVPSTERPQKTPPPPAHKKRVLVIDDDQGMVRAYRRLLQHHDATVLDSGIDALRLIERGAAFDVILCDLMMPDFDGVAFYERLEQTAPTLVSRVVFCTGGAFTSRSRSFLASVSNVVLDKPVDAEKLRLLLGDMRE